MELNDRVTRLESDMKNVQDDVCEIKEHLKETATKEDVINLKDYFEDRDRDFIKNMWKVIFGLIITIVTIAMSLVGIDKIPKIF
ncbi:hypothetical protein SAMN06265827_105126 [Orenia metallireducens]|uniref:Haemolysin XhlA n=1 Tax=Orenia metallireducens TaxID=1413210 RepID=A0A285G7A1_9FIRM|nr:hypothetical protein [Orenia metallireducens]SNY19462.1 hypothetical protein SAMN06265827_105126 [Orenia metallireducens]